MPNAARNLKKIFISYRREDSQPFAERIHDYLDERFPGEVFLDTSTGGRSNDWREELQFQTGGCDVMVVVIGQQWADSRDEKGRPRLQKPRDPVRMEIKAALGRSIPVIVVLVDKAEMPKTLPKGIANLSRCPRVEVRNNPYFKADVQLLLIKMISERLPGSPYRSLHNFYMKTRRVAEVVGWVFIAVALVLLPVLLVSSLVPASLAELVDYFQRKPGP